MSSENLTADEIINTCINTDTTTIHRHLASLALLDPDERRASLRDVLTVSGLDYSVQKIEPTIEVPRGVENYIVSIGDLSEPHLLFCAHYDAYPGSCGANDNSAAVCILIELACQLKKLGSFNAEFAFFDGEESKNTGSKLYLNESGTSTLSAAINLDLCGYGDTIAVYSHGNASKEPVRNFCDKSILSRHNGQLVKFLPHSDDIVFNGRHLPTLSIAIMPKWDVKNLPTLAAYESNILGKPPEFELIIGQMEVVTTIHGSFRDKISSVQPAAMQQVFDYLIDSLTSPLAKKKLFGIF